MTKDTVVSFLRSPKEASVMNNGNDDAATDVMKGREEENSEAVNTDDCKNSRIDAKNNGNAEASVPSKKRSRSSLEVSNKEDEGNAKASKEHVLEFKWSKYNDEDDDDKHFSMFEDEITDSSLGISRVISENEEGENNEYSLIVCLVDGKSEDRRSLAKINVYFWKEGDNLMNFNQLSQDLADFSRSLWSASGRNVRHYSDMDIEMGNSRHSGVEIRKLVKEATDEVWPNDIVYSDDVMYIQTAALAEGSNANESLELLSRLFTKVGVFAIAHKTDLEKMGFCVREDMVGVSDEAYQGDMRFDFIEGGDGWFVISHPKDTSDD